ncbi:diguanylate cyclase [Pseudomonas sp. ICBG1301]|uniref:sensor domain-containing diguanylate cyclase n=1 Tax=Pseudomonas sp. ICBG1301 TaxID=2795987 RepID=UPI0019668E04|nr:diguanylate cyclase [Pseudomonas sp. ICBG1301]MBM9485415.1 diguanylate cyclase [Pseudomonas sp. ICBG1301]
MRSHLGAFKVADVIFCTLICLTGIAVTVLVLTFYIRTEQRTASVAFKLEVDERFSRVQRRFSVQDLKLDTVKRFFINADDVTEKEFMGFVTPLVEEGETYGWVQRIQQKDLESFRAEALLNGTSDFSYHEINPLNGQTRPLTERAEHWILLYLLSLDDVKITPGTDVMANPNREALFTRARESHQMVVSDPLKMSSGQFGVFFIAPVFGPDATIPEHDDGLQGYVVSTVRLAFLMEQNIPLASMLRLNVTLSTIDAAAGEYIYQSSTPPADSELYERRLLNVADNTYVMQFRPGPAFSAANSHVFSSGLIVVSGAVLTLLMTAMMFLLITQRTRALSLVAERTQELQTMNITDHLTGVYNRRYFETSMARLLIEANIQRQPLSLIMFDIDHFKLINDRKGHLCGDKVLRLLCARISAAIRKSDLLCRTGGEEFALICPSSELNDAGKLAEKLRLLISALPFEEAGQVSCSFGVATWAPPESFEDLMRRVDAAMYAAKSGGRDRVQLASRETCAPFV